MRKLASKNGAKEDECTMGNRRMSGLRLVEHAKIRLRSLKYIEIEVMKSFLVSLL